MQYPVGQFVNEAGLLGHVDELGGAGDAAVGFAPAQQRLDARRLEAVQRHLRLVHEQQVSGLDLAAQRPLESKELRRGSVERRTVEGETLCSQTLATETGQACQA